LSESQASGPEVAVKRFTTWDGPEIVYREWGEGTAPVPVVDSPAALRAVIVVVGTSAILRLLLI
jgi:hypothetical protein